MHQSFFFFFCYPTVTFLFPPCWKKQYRPARFPCWSMLAWWGNQCFLMLIRLLALEHTLVFRPTPLPNPFLISLRAFKAPVASLLSLSLPCYCVGSSVWAAFSLLPGHTGVCINTWGACEMELTILNSSFIVCLQCCGWSLISLG